MVTLKQTGFECEYEMGVFMRLYFKKDQNARVSTVFSEDDLSAVCTIEYDGKIFEEKVGIDIKPFYDGDVIRKAYKNAVVESFCRAAGHIRSIPRPWGVMSGIRPAKNMRLLCEKFDREQTDSIFGDIYYVTEEKRRLAYEVCKNEADIVNSHDERSAGIYIGIPFCPTRCSYCSFISSPIKVSGRYIPEYVSLLTEEIKKTGEIMRKAGIYAESIYMGGGTPTALNADMLDDIFGALERYIDMTGVKEMTLEAGRPDTIDEEKLVTALRHGVNRISINPQTMHRTTLERIGRRHTPEDIEESFALARRCG
ncbi:MAG: radical SAM protein, partial [Oscillospiraceae bacterium]|nr:radical SAM protein [Oscillospiraceae bacterium]